MDNQIFHRARLIDPLVSQMLDRGYGAQEIIEALVQRNEDLSQRIIALEMLVPRKIRIGDNKFAIWHCPDELIPESK